MFALRISVVVHRHIEYVFIRKLLVVASLRECEHIRQREHLALAARLVLPVEASVPVVIVISGKFNRALILIYRTAIGCVHGRLRRSGQVEGEEKSASREREQVQRVQLVARVQVEKVYRCRLLHLRTGCQRVARIAVSYGLCVPRSCETAVLMEYSVVGRHGELTRLCGYVSARHRSAVADLCLQRGRNAVHAAAVRHHDVQYCRYSLGVILRSRLSDYLNFLY